MFTRILRKILDVFVGTKFGTLFLINLFFVCGLIAGTQRLEAFFVALMWFGANVLTMLVTYVPTKKDE